jgi:ribosome recycling factor
MASDITGALITGGFALGGVALGAAAAIATPWVGWTVEKRRRRQDRRAALIQQWRVDIRQLRNAEKNHLAQNEENKKLGETREA